MTDRPSKNPDELARDVDAAVRIRDQKEWLRLSGSLALGWMEMFLLSGLFAFGIGMVVTVIFALPQENEKLYYFMCLWILGFVGMVMVCLEFLIRKFRTIRRVIELNHRRLKRLERFAEQQNIDEKLSPFE